MKFYKSKFIILLSIIFQTLIFVQCSDKITGPSELKNINYDRIVGGFNICKVYEYGQCKNNGLAQLWQIDDDGNVYEKIYYSIDGQIEDTYKCKFDNKGKIIEESSWYKNNCYWRMSYLYNEHEKLSKHTFYKSPFSENSVLCYLIFTYDEHLNNLETRQYNADGTIAADNNFSYVNKYDNKWNLIESIMNKSGSIILSKTNYSYDNKNRLIKEKIYMPDGHFTTQISYKYDNSNNITEEIRYDGEKVTTIYSFKYNNFNKKIEEISDEVNGVLNKQEFLYDSNLNIIQKTRFGNGIQYLLVKYEYLNE